MTMTFSGDGTITGLTAGGLPNSTVQQADLATGVAGNGPAFSASGSGQAFSSSTWTKIQLSTEQFDTASCFNNTGSAVGGIPAYAFLPNVAGYYNISAGAGHGASAYAIIVSIYKNGSSYQNAMSLGVSGAFDPFACASCVVYMNGTTDYIEAYLIANTAQTTTACRLSGALVRAA